MRDPKSELGEYIRGLLGDGQIRYETTASDLIGELDERLDVEGVKRGEKKLERIRAFLKTLSPDTTAKKMSEWL